MHVYVITNTVNGKIYVGQHSGDNLQKYLNRRCNMALRGVTRTVLIDRAIRKYGRQAFVIQSLVNPIDKPQMDGLEKFFIRTFESRNPEIGYNITAGGGGALGVVSTRKGTKQKPLSEETRRKIGLAHRARTFTKEHLLKLSKANKGQVPWCAGKSASTDAVVKRIADATRHRMANMSADEMQAHGEKITKSKLGQVRTDSKSGVAGVRWDKQHSRWQAAISVRGVKTFLGRFKDKNDAIAARKAAEEQLCQVAA